MMAIEGDTRLPTANPQICLYFESKNGKELLLRTTLRRLQMSLTVGHGKHCIIIDPFLDCLNGAVYIGTDVNKLTTLRLQGYGKAGRVLGGRFSRREINCPVLFNYLFEFEDEEIILKVLTAAKE